jgi:hypothetical protein
VDLRTRRQVVESNFGRLSGWHIEYGAHRIGALIDFEPHDHGWDSYRVEPASPLSGVDLFDPALWYPDVTLSFRSRLTLSIAPYAFSAPPGDDLHSARRVHMRGVYLTVPSWAAAAHATLRNTLRARAG